MFNALIQTSAEHCRKMIALRAGLQRIERRLHQPHIVKLVAMCPFTSDTLSIAAEEGITTPADSGVIAA